MKGKEEVKRYIKELVAKKVREMGISSLPLILQEVKREYETVMKEYVRDVEQSWKAFKGNLLEEVIKATLRERIAQTGYWKLKLSSSPITKNIKVFFITLDEDGDFRVKSPAKKGRAIAEVDTDGVFLITSSNFEESQKVKGIEYFEKVLKELKKLCQRIHP
jgi:hypothetical protein